MTRITTRVSDEMVEALDAAAAKLRRSRADLMRQALEQYLEDFDDVSAALDRLQTRLTLFWTGMMSGDVLGRIKRSAAKELANLPQQNKLRVSLAINSLGEQPFAGSVLKGGLEGCAGCESETIELSTHCWTTNLCC